jgi:hypothetical protein
MASSLASGRVAQGAAAAADAGLRVSGGVVAVDGDVAEAGLRVHYDKLTLLLDSGLPMGGNCKVGLNFCSPCGDGECVLNCRIYWWIAAAECSLFGAGETLCML